MGEGRDWEREKLPRKEPWTQHPSSQTFPGTPGMRGTGHRSRELSVYLDVRWKWTRNEKKMCGLAKVLISQVLSSA